MARIPLKQEWQNALRASRTCARELSMLSGVERNRLLATLAGVLRRESEALTGSPGSVASGQTLEPDPSQEKRCFKLVLCSLLETCTPSLFQERGAGG